MASYSWTDIPYLKKRIHDLHAQLVELETQVENLISVSGVVTVDEEVGSGASASGGSITLSHQNSGGASSVVFKSSRSASDYGFIEYRDNYQPDFEPIQIEKSALIIGVMNDESGLNQDRIYFQCPDFAFQRSNVARMTGNDIVFYKPVIQEAWLPNQLISKQIYCYPTHTSKTTYLMIPKSNSAAVEWNTFTYNIVNPDYILNSIIRVEIDLNYFMEGSDHDDIQIQLINVLPSGNLVVGQKTQHYNGSGGGGTRSGALTPCIFYFRVTTSAPTLTLRVSFKNFSTDDNLYVCSTNGSDTDYNWSVTISEYYI